MANLVTVDNFRRAESDMYFASTIKRAGGVGRLEHHRELMPVDEQTVVRANRDTLYSSGVFDLDAGPVTITLPDAGKRFMSLMILDEEQYANAVVYGAGSYTLSKQKIGTRYMMVAIRTLIDPSNSKDIVAAHALQDAIKVSQASFGHFDVPEWDRKSQSKVRDALVALGSTVSDSRRMFGPRNQVDPVHHLIGTAIGWGGNPEQDATYLIVTPRLNDGTTVHELVVKDVPVDGFWSISVYNAQGYFERNSYEAYTLNDFTARKGADGSVAVRFGDCDGKTANCLPITPGWNYMVRLYRPRAEILNGRWIFPEASPVR